MIISIFTSKRLYTNPLRRLKLAKHFAAVLADVMSKTPLGCEATCHDVTFRKRSFDYELLP